jgi:RNA polymerase sigma-70 factor (ECF subfamily)
MNEARAIDLCLRHRDPAGFEFLVRQYRREAFVHAIALLGSAPDAEDACQECFLKAYRALPVLPALDRFYPWFYRILRNHCLNVLERRRTRSCNADAALDRCAPEPLPRPAEGLLAKEDRQAVRAALARLAPEDREVLTLKYLDDLPYAEIALRLGIPRGTVMSRLYHARWAFRHEFRGLEP